MPENRLQDVIVDELSLVDEPATGIRWKFIKKKIAGWFRKQESPMLPSTERPAATPLGPPGDQQQQQRGPSP